MQLRFLLMGAAAGAMLGILACSGPAPGTSAPASESAPEPLATDQWTYLQVDSNKAMWGAFAEPEWLRYFGLAAADFNADGYLDLVSGRTVYFNPGGDMTGPWTKTDLGQNVDANLAFVPAGTQTPIILGEALPDVIRFLPDGENGFTAGEVVAQVPPTGHHNGQGYKTADLMVDKEGEEVIYASQGGLYVMDASGATPWPTRLVGKDASDEGFGVADMDGDGDLDLVSGYRVPGADAEVPTVLVWFENPGAFTHDWERHAVGNSQFAIDRVEAGDLNGDGLSDVVVAEERYPGLEPDATLWYFVQVDTGFIRKALVTQFSMNNLDLADLDQDGDLDIITAEHKGERLALQMFENDGSGNFSLRELDRGKESHLGTQTYDLDGDGDLDIVSIGWDQHQFVHVWRNDAR